MLSLCAWVLIRMDRLRRCELAVAPRKQSVWIPMRNLQARRTALRGRYRAQSAHWAQARPLRAGSMGAKKERSMNLVVWLPAMFALGRVSLGVCYAFIFACENI